MNTLIKRFLVLKHQFDNAKNYGDYPSIEEAEYIMEKSNDEIIYWDLQTIIVDLYNLFYLQQLLVLCSQ